MDLRGQPERIFQVGADGNLNRYQPGRYVDHIDTKYLKEWVRGRKVRANMGGTAEAMNVR